MMGYLFKLARTEEEMQQIHRLNYKTFACEIPQHEPNDDQILIDQFHKENTYIIAVKKQQVIGMISVRSNRPFSLDRKLGILENHLPVNATSPCEIRLLAVEKGHRNGRVFLGLARALIRYCLKKGYDAAVISGTTRQLKLYEQMGFKPFAHLTGKEGAYYQPMYLTEETFYQSLAGRILPEGVQFLPGPVKIEKQVQETFIQSPISHRSKPFSSMMNEVRERLKEMTRANDVQIMLGSGTLANDVIAAQLSLLEGMGLILSNGEFGERLIQHATRFQMTFDCHRVEWGHPFDLTKVEQRLKTKHYQWIWFVHCETATGVLNDLEALKLLSQKYDTALCVDCISSIGVVPLNLSHVLFASGVSGKGIGSYTGLSFVFHQKKLKEVKTLPLYLDLGNYESSNSIPYSHSSNLINAFLEALKQYDQHDRYEKIKIRYEKLRTSLTEHKIPILTKVSNSSPTIVTIPVPRHIPSKDLGDDLYINGYLVHYESQYLIDRNWIQLSCISEDRIENYVQAVNVLRDLLEYEREPLKQMC
ncbi:aminotransferase class V-fold PLP-dependent enzyme [Bacillus sp. FJAT-47783]|uniref:aminotransferase class V-fold PLP-dependent enzyme n=1 Tax=Bacillus sp. FJAT-47783 TaxID=2922712 RepID=UPI001FAC5279|nr:aminotransferase class V-fold PLP-dependent enzyme [Bacillus sp. FJAT-47783]